MARGRSSSSSSKWRYCNPSYYLKRPKRLALLFIVFVCASFFVWDRQSLVREHEVEILKLNGEMNQLKTMLEGLKSGGGDDGKLISEKKDVPDEPIDVERRQKVKEAMIHAWSSYEKYAWGHDELQPQSKQGIDSFGGLGATLIDALDTLYIMGLDEQFQRAREWVANSLDFNKDYDASVFETTIRVVGGLLSAYDLSGDKVFLEKARDIADRLLPAWNTPTGIPYNTINLVHGNAHNPGWTGGDSILADSGTEQLEFIALSHRTGDPKYQQKAENVIAQLNKTFPDDGLLPIYISPDRGLGSYSTITFGAMGDSFYEYLLKVWIQGNKTSAVRNYREMWEKSMKGLLSLVRKTTPSSFTYLCEKNGDSLSDKMDELACFAPGMLALGSSGYGPDESQKIFTLAEEHVCARLRSSAHSYVCIIPLLLTFVALFISYVLLHDDHGASVHLGHWNFNLLPSIGTCADFPRDMCMPLIRLHFVDLIGYSLCFGHSLLAWTCYNFYQSTPTKLAGENYFFRPGEDMSVGTSWNILRPETVESLFYLWRLTGNRTYQEWGWNIFQAFEKNSRIETGYVGLKDVNTGVKDNMMQSFFLAETLKYLYLLFSPSSVISLDEWVFNTEAHPLKIVTRHDGEHVGQSKNSQTSRTLGRKEGHFG
ncbi:hypothetical protein POTOM_030736 [Populus tomentosa]|uniref:Alpha-1,2-Mannosidase n=1 Tax=Populus tomentosa TaxID=118781 RepID=A0A8X7Z9D8_POPTO|nr:hypothetical protein POTOM_030736 [Populus tomentosa]